MTSGLRILGILFTVLGLGLLGASLYVGDSMFGAASLGLGITGLTFLVMGPIFFLVSRAIPSPNRRILASGIDGEATITRAAPTGWAINRDGRIVNLTLEVRVPGRAPYTATKRELVAVWSLANLAGQVLPVKVDPDDPASLELIWSSAGTVGNAWGPATFSSTVVDASGGRGNITVRQLDSEAAMALAQSLAEPGSTEIPGMGVTITRGEAGEITITTAAGSQIIHASEDEPGGSVTRVAPRGPAPARGPADPIGSPFAVVPPVRAVPGTVAGGLTVADNSDLEATGFPGRGTINSFTDTGIVIGDARVYQLQLTAATGARPTYAVTHTVLVPASAFGRLAVGASVAIRVDPSDADRIFVEWDRP